MNLASVLTSVLPSVGVLAIFVYVMRGITRADRREREAMANYDRQQAQAAASLTEKNDRKDSGAPSA
jgi:hypothetical protein